MRACPGGGHRPGRVSRDDPARGERAMTDSAPTRPRVAVVFGGTSSEHAISCLTAGSVLAAIDCRPLRRGRPSASPAPVAGSWCPTELHDRLPDRRRRAARDQRGPARRHLAADHGRHRPGRADRARRRTRARRQHRPRTDAAELGAGPARLARRGVRAAARPVRRGRHHPGHVRDDGHPLRRRRGAGQRRRHGQDLHEARAGRLRPADRTVRPDPAARTGRTTAPPAWRPWPRCTTRCT